MAEVRSWRERKEKAFNLKSKQEVRFDRVVSVQERTQAALWRQPEREHPMPRIGHNCSRSLLLPSHTPAPTFHSLVIPWYMFPASCFASTNLMPSRLCSQHLVSRPDNGAFTGPWVLPKSYAWFRKSSVLGEPCSQKATRPGFWRQSWLLPTCKGYSWTVSAVGSPRPGTWLAWFPKASTLTAESNDKN